MGDSRVQQFVPVKYDGTDISTKIPNTPIKVDRLKPTINTETLAANKTLATTDYITQWLNPDGTTRTITMPAEASSTYLFFVIYNTGTVVGVNLNIEDDASAALITINYDEAAVLTCNGTTWIATKFSTSNGNDLDMEVKEENTSAISKGQVTYISGATGVAYPDVGLADCEDENKIRVAGIAIDDIVQNSTGITRCCGVLEGVDTRSTNTDINPNAESWSAGDQLWLSSTPGGMTNVKPTSGRIIKAAGALTDSTANGKLLIKLHENPVFLAAASGEDIILRMGDNAGTNKVSFKDYANNEVAYLNSDGVFSAGILALYQGVAWNESTDAYTRTGSLTGVPASQSAENSLLPIQSQMRRCVINDSGVVQYYLDPFDSTKKTNGDAASLDGTDGQVMVEIPAFYYKYGYNGNVHTWEISKYPRYGFSLHPAFIKNGANVAYRYIGAYEGSLYDDSATRYTNGLQLTAGSTDFVNATKAITRTGESHPFSLLEVGDKIVVAGTTNNNGTFTVATAGDQTIIVSEAIVQELAVATATVETEKDFANDILCSVSAKAPINDLTRANGRTIAAKRGTGWRQQDYDLISAIQLLYLVEYADFYNQSMIGNGLTDWASGTWTGWNDLNPIETTGNSNSDGDATANTSGGDGVTGSYMSYRGIENFYGHIWKWVDGININDNIPYVSNTDTQFADDTITNYTALGVTLHNANGYQNTLEQISRGFLPASVGASSSTKITDYYYQNTGWRVVILGGAADYGASAGAFYLHALNASSFVYRGLGVRLAF